MSHLCVRVGICIKESTWVFKTNSNWWWGMGAQGGTALGIRNRRKKQAVESINTKDSSSVFESSLQL